MLVPVVDARGADAAADRALRRTCASIRDRSPFRAGGSTRTTPPSLAAACREAEEEIGLDSRYIRPLGYLDPYLSTTNYLVMPVVARVVAGSIRLDLNPHEVADTFEVPLGFLMDPDASRTPFPRMEGASAPLLCNALRATLHLGCDGRHHPQSLREALHIMTRALFRDWCCFFLPFAVFAHLSRHRAGATRCCGPTGASNPSGSPSPGLGFVVRLAARHAASWHERQTGRLCADAYGERRSCPGHFE